MARLREILLFSARVEHTSSSHYSLLQFKVVVVVTYTTLLCYRCV